MTTELLPREFFDRPVEEVAPALLGQVLAHRNEDGEVLLRLTEVEAYAGPLDPASHAYRGRTQRNAVMFGPPGFSYVYFTYGMHFCMNLVCAEEGTASAVLLRAGEVISGVELAASRRPRSTVRDLARGPARLCQALAIGREQYGLDVCSPDSPLRILAGEPGPAELISTGPRTGVNGAKETPWRFWIEGDPTVSPYRAHVPRKRTVVTDEAIANGRA
ncbi:DNA-3-methyladenine glycosylase [Actinomadura fulvescens]|uniref:Putative 3-methyladenine DNA glycosylase n=1 Tax=Actinomadura fulvescens TaxID=46160 RepID=A0ABP6D3P3_9ACTN